MGGLGPKTLRLGGWLIPRSIPLPYLVILGQMVTVVQGSHILGALWPCHIEMGHG